MTANIVIRPNVVIRPNTIVKAFAGPTLLLDSANYHTGSSVWTETSGHGYNATGYSTTFSNGVVNFTAGSFAAVAPGVYFGHKFSIEGWVNVTSYANWSRLLDFGNGAEADNVIFSVDSNGGSGLPAFGIVPGPNIYSNTQLPLNQWVHLVATYNGTNGNIYMNGQQVASSPMSTPTQVPRNYCYIGKSNWGGDAGLEGAIGHLEILPYALTAVQIEDRFQIGAGGIYQNNPPTPTGFNLIGPPSALTNGTVWTDGVSGVEATINGTWTHTTAHGGGIVLAGDGWIEIEGGTNSNPTFTLSMAADFESANGNWNTIFSGGYYPSANIFAYISGGNTDSISVGTHGDEHQPTGSIVNTGLAWWDFVYDGTSVAVYKNGASVLTATLGATNTGWTSPLWFGNRYDATDYMNGTYYQIKYVETALDAAGIAAQYNALASGYGLDQYTPPVSGYSLGFDGTNEKHVTITGSTGEWALGNTYTIEWWEKLVDPSYSTSHFYSVVNQSADTTGIDAYHANREIGMFNGSIRFAEPAHGVWNHIALVKNGTTAIAYINGQSQPFIQNTANTLSNTIPTITIGSRTDGSGNYYGQYFAGQITNIRISNVARYSGAFTPPLTMNIDANTLLAVDGTLTDLSTYTHAVANSSATVSSDFPSGNVHSYTVKQQINNTALVVNLADYPNAGIVPIDAACTINGVDTTVLGTYATSELVGYPTQIIQFPSDAPGTIAPDTLVVFTWVTAAAPSIIIDNMSVGHYPPATATVDFTSNFTQSRTGTIFFAWGFGTSGPHSITVNPGYNVYTSPDLGLVSSGNDLTAQITIASGLDACTSNIFTSAWNVICLVEGTMITMADGSYKAVEDVRYDDLIRVWNFDLGEFSEALPIFVKQEETHHEHNRFTFSDGTVLRTVGHHVFNKQAGAFTMLVRDTTPVGTITVNELGEEVTLVSKETIQESVKFYNVWTQYHLNLFADGILTSNRFNNIYPIQDMKFVKDSRALRPLEEFANIDPKYISGLRLQEQPKQYTAEYIKDYIDNKLERLNIDQLGDIKV